MTRDQRGKAVERTLRRSAPLSGEKRRKIAWLDRLAGLRCLGLGLDMGRAATASNRCGASEA